LDQSRLGYNLRVVDEPRTTKLNHVGDQRTKPCVGLEVCVVQSEMAGHLGPGECGPFFEPHPTEPRVPVKPSGHEPRHAAKRSGLEVGLAMKVGVAEVGGLPDLHIVEVRVFGEYSMVERRLFEAPVRGLQQPRQQLRGESGAAEIGLTSGVDLMALTEGQMEQAPIETPYPDPDTRLDLAQWPGWLDGGDGAAT
jgi:hypothetical protein